MAFLNIATEVMFFFQARTCSRSASFCYKILITGACDIDNAEYLYKEVCTVPYLTI